jgi:hypothetical protein
MDTHFRPQQPQASFSEQSGWLYGWVDTSVPGHRQIELGGTTYNIPSGYYRGDEIATELTALGCQTLLDARFTVGSNTAATLTSTDRLAVLMGFTVRAGQTLAAATKHEALVYSPVAIPIYGAIWNNVTVDADDVYTLSRVQRTSGYCWGAVRVWDVEILMPRASFEALQFGWCTKGRVTIVCGVDAPMSATQTGGSIQGQVLAVGRPEWLAEVEQVARVTMRIAEEP